MGIKVAQGRLNFLGKNTAGSKRDISVNNCNFFGAAKMPANEIFGKRPKQLNFEQADLFSAGSEIGQHLTAGAGYRTGGDQDDIGVPALDGFDRAVSSIKNRCEIPFLFWLDNPGRFPWPFECCSASPCKRRESPVD